MSSLIFHIAEDRVIIATDTLAVTHSDNVRPFNFTTKAHILPHLKLIVAGTGAGGFVDSWLVHINTGLRVEDVDNLNEHTPESLSKRWKEWTKECPIGEPNSVTVYHFGFSKRTGQIHAYAYRSEKNFYRELLRQGNHAKPDCKLPTKAPTPKVIREMMTEQRAIQEAAEGRRVYIGGEITLHTLTKRGFSVSTIGRFNDYEKTASTIFENPKG
jgi:hypothetical protein